MAFRWFANDGWLVSFVIFRGSGLVLLKILYFRDFFLGGGGGRSGPPVTPSGTARVFITIILMQILIGNLYVLHFKYVCTFFFLEFKTFI